MKMVMVKMVMIRMMMVDDDGNFYIGEKWKVQPSSEVNPGELRSVSKDSLSAQCWISVLPPVRN